MLFLQYSAVVVSWLLPLLVLLVLFKLVILLALFSVLVPSRVLLPRLLLVWVTL
jgi:hypothetical protein